MCAADPSPAERPHSPDRRLAFLRTDRGRRSPAGDALQAAGWTVSRRELPSEVGSHASVEVIEVEKLAEAVVPAQHRGSPGPPCVVVSPQASARDTRRLLATGVNGIVLSQDVSRALVPVIGAVLVGQICVPGGHQLQVTRPGLSQRERQVIGMVALGLSNYEIASRLYLAESTVKSHLSAAFAKLGVRSRAEAVEMVVDPASGLTHGIMFLGAQPLTPVDPE